MPKQTNEAFGLFDYSMFPKLNRILKPHGVQLKKRTSRNWGDQVRITVVKQHRATQPDITMRPQEDPALAPFSEQKSKRRKKRNTQPQDAGIGMSGMQMGN